MPDFIVENPFAEGLRALGTDRMADALDWFGKAVEQENTPLARSYLAYCRAKVEGAHNEAAALCMEAIKEEPKNSGIYLNLGRIYLLSGHKRAAMRAFELGLRCGKNSQIESEFNAIGRRKSPPIPFLKRNNPANKLLGKILKKLGLR